MSFPTQGVARLGLDTSAVTNRAMSKWVAVGLLVLTVGQLAIATFVPGLEQFEGKGFAARLIAYPVMMLLVPAIWWAKDRRRGRSGETGPGSAPRPAPPWAAFAWIM